MGLKAWSLWFHPQKALSVPNRTASALHLSRMLSWVFEIRSECKAQFCDNLEIPLRNMLMLWTPTKVRGLEVCTHNFIKASLFPHLRATYPLGHIKCVTSGGLPSRPSQWSELCWEDRLARFSYKTSSWSSAWPAQPAAARSAPSGRPHRWDKPECPRLYPLWRQRVCNAVGQLLSPHHTASCGSTS